MEIDRSANTVRLEIVAGASDPNNRWNFNGYARGQATITVPRGYEITIEFRNDDSDVPHSLGVGELPDSSFPPMFEDPQPVFEGAISASPTSMTESALPGESETVTFTADEAGEYALLCYIPAHAVTGMWIRFVVSGDGEAGFEADTDGGSQRSRAGSGAGRRRSW
jgi:sulfocyanin